MSTTPIREIDRLHNLPSRADILSASRSISRLKQNGDKIQIAVSFILYYFEGFMSLIGPMQLFQYQQKYEFSQDELSRLQALLAQVTGEKTVIEERFQALEEKHEQLVRIREEESRKLSKKLKLQTTLSERLAKDLKKTQCNKYCLDQKCKLLERQVHALKGKIESDKAAHQHKVERLTSNHSNEVEKLKRNVES